MKTGGFLLLAEPKGNVKEKHFDAELEAGTAEVTDEESRTVIARLRNLNLHGCYVEMANPLPEKSEINIKVTAGNTVFQASGQVVYSDRHAGSGVEFQNVEPRFQAVLEEWLLEAQELNKQDE